jgi:lipid-binding SYLF domain-containing protein
MGTGLVIAKLDDGSWSAPSAIATFGVGWGAQVGAQVTNYVLVLSTVAAVNAFTGRGQLSLGAEIDVAAGPLGRSAAMYGNVSKKGAAACYTYAHSKGLVSGLQV